METIEHKIGDTFCLEDETKLQVVKANCNCKGCYFFNDKDNRCSRTKDIICSAPRREDKEFVIFKQIKNNNMKKKMTIDIYVVMQMHKQYRSFCDVFTSFEEADAKFEELLKYFKEFNKVQPRGWTTKSIPSQIKVSIIGDTTLYLCKETKKVEIEETIPEPVFDEPKFRSFFSSYNCFSESIKHTPFGVLINKENIYFTILDINEYGISVVGDKRKIELISFEDASKLFNYADGSPFGYII